MSKKIAGRKVRMFRCERPPLIGGKTLQAHMVKDLGWDAEVNEEATGLIITTGYGSQHFVAFTNIQNTEFFPDEPKEEATVTDMKPRMGRPPKSPA